MTTTLTIRLPTAQRAALKRRAAALKTTESRLVCELVEVETAQISPALLVEKWAGVVDSRKTSQPPHALRSQIRERNWRK